MAVPIPTQASSSGSGSDVEGSVSVTGMIKKILSAKTSSNLFDKVLCTDSVSSRTGLDFSSLCLLPPPAEVPESILKEVEGSQLAPPTSTNTIPSPISKPTGFKPYSSPLLTFSSYRLNPAFRSGENGPLLRSLSYSNKIDPMKVMCKFDLTGVCVDPKCSAQHIRDVSMSKEAVVRDLVSFAPTVAGCTTQELATSDQPHVVEAISTKIASYSSKLVERYGNRVSQEELYKVAVHEANGEKMKTRPRKEFIHFEDRPWSGDGAMPLLTSDTPLGKARGQTPVSPIMDVGPADLEDRLISSPVNEERRRYFTVEGEGPKQDSASPSSAESVARQLLSERKLSGAAEVLEDSLKQDSSSEDTWILYLKVKSQMASSSRLPEFYKLLRKAVSTSHSYSVIFETVRLARCFKSKLKAISDGLVELRSSSTSQESPALVSRRCFELFINAILLHLITRRHSNALKHFEQAYKVSEEASTVTSSTSFRGLLGVLVRSDRILFALCHLSVLYNGQLPCSLMAPETSHTCPVKLCSFKPFAVPFDKSTNIPPHDYKKILRLFKVYFGLFQDSEVPSCEAVELNLPLYKNLLLFEATHGDHQKAINMLCKLTALCPQLLDLRITYASVKELGGADTSEVLQEASLAYPRRAELFYFAAKLELSRQCSCEGVCVCKGNRRIQSAVQWLVKCVKDFYAELPAKVNTKLALILYRKLLNQMIGYDQTVPPFAKEVYPSLLKDEVPSLWMCYCLLVEITTPPPSSTGAELFHQSAEEAYESALLNVRNIESHKTVWREYIHYLRRQGVSTAEAFRRLISCVQRCMVDVQWTYSFPTLTNTNPSSTELDSNTSAKRETETYEDYSFHNEMINLVADCLPPSSSLKLSLLRKFSRLLPKNTALLSQVVKCALLQSPICIHLAQTSLAEYLAVYPHSPQLWKLAIEIELQLKNTREARWMFNKALASLPVHARLWMEFLDFELQQACVLASPGGQGAPPTSSSPPITAIQRILALVKNAHQFGVDLVSVVREVSSGLPTNPLHS